MNRKDTSALIKKTVRNLLDENSEFKQFLEKNNAKGKFIKSITEYNMSNHYNIINENNRLIADYNVKVITNEIKYKLESKDPMLMSFNWKDTAQSHHYWNNLYEKWCNRHNTNN